MNPTPLLLRRPILLLLACGLLFHLPWLAGPFGFGENNINATFFFGPFAQHWEKFGWLTLRGAPLGATALTLPETVGAGFPYFNHPPGFAWLCCLLGTAEWQLRLPCVLAVIASGPLLFALLRSRLGAGPAWLAGLLVMIAPGTAYAAVISYESVVIAFGLLLLLAHEHTAAGDRRWRMPLVLAAALGVWIDWAFVFYVAALLPWSLPAAPRELLRRLWLPAAAAAVSLALVFAWRLWAEANPELPPPGPTQETIGRTLHRAVFGGPPWGAFFAALGDRLVDAFSRTGLGVALLGLPLALRACPRLVVALLLPPLLNFGIFRSHSMGHLMFAAYAVPPLAVLVAAVPHTLRRWRPAATVAVAAGALVAAMVGWHTVEFERGATSPLLARVAAALSRMAAEPLPQGHPDPGDDRPPLVATNSPQIPPYYVTSPRVLLAPVADPRQLDAQRAGPARIVYVHFQNELHEPGKPPLVAPDQPLRDFLAPFPHIDLPEFVGEWPMGHGRTIVIRGAGAWFVPRR
ncbi:MAG: glycosyltransferase family 39 protein [Planctomycetes bacterium]|nr:glycosyltransferase family 39 protein [Planctomycetota bacterium]MCB9887582.1 glycosyltransferase family 39 protein [Planctomycetota bacterium]